MFNPNPTPSSTAPTAAASQTSASSTDPSAPIAALPNLSPDAVDTLAQLNALLSKRLRVPGPGTATTSDPKSAAPPSDANRLSAPGAGAGATTTTTSAPTPSAPGGGGGGAAAATPGGTTTTTTSPPDQQQQQQALTPLTLAPAADALRHRVQKARAALLRGLPDLERGVGAQEAEMAELEGRLRRQREVVARLRGMRA